MKKIFSVFCAFLSVLCFSLLTPVYAQESNQDGLIVTEVTNKNEYEKDEDIVYTLHIINTNGYDIYINKIENYLPNGYKLMDSKEYKDILIKSGGSFEKTFNLKVENKIGVEEKPVIKDNLDKNDSQKKEETKNNEGSNTGLCLENKIVLLSFAVLISFVVILILVRIGVSNKSLMILLALSMSVMSSGGYVVKANDERIITTEYRCKIDGIENIIKTNIYYYIDEEESIPDSTTYTRAQWIYLILSAYGVDNIDANYFESSFTDIQNNEYISSILTAEAYQIIDSSTGMFSPNQMATREFAATTTNKLLGFTTEGVPTCNDLSMISDANSVFIALKQGYMTLLNGDFNPKSALDGKSGERILKYIKVIKDSMKPSNKNVVEYNDNVVVLKSDTLFEDDGKIIKLLKSTFNKKPKLNDLFVIDRIKSFKVDSIQEDVDNYLISYSQPEFEDVFSKIDIGYDSTTLGSTAVFFEANNDTEAYAINDNQERNQDKDEKKKIKIFEIKDGDECNQKNITLIYDKTKFQIKSKVNVKTNFQFDKAKLFNVENVSIVPELTTFIESPELKLSADQEIEIGTWWFVGGEIPIISTNGQDNLDTGIFLKLICHITAEGKVTLMTKTNVQAGIQILNGDYRLVKSFHMDKFELAAEGEIGIGPKFDLGMRFLGYKICDAYADVALRLKGTMIVHYIIPKPFTCSDVKSYLYLKLSLGQDGVAIRALSEVLNEKNWEHIIFDDKNSPLNCSKHYENLKPISECTFDQKKYHEITFDIRDSVILEGMESVVIKFTNDNIEQELTTNSLGLTEKIGVSGNGKLTYTINHTGYCQVKGELDLSTLLDFENRTVRVIMVKVPDDAVYNSENGSYYKAFTGYYSWEDAESACEMMGGHLATITSKEEQEFIETNRLTGRRWIGLHLDSNKSWTWVTGETSDYYNWGPGEPNNSSNVLRNENSVALWPVKWNDLNNNSYEQSGFLCEWDFYRINSYISE